jgi:drug/metabolite transporter (DMT)-like permease
VLLAALGAAGFASKGVFAKFLYADGWSVEAVMTTRAVLSLPVMAAWAYLRLGRALFASARPAAVAGAALAGALCYYVGARMDFQALTTLDAGVERVLLFSYPAEVVLLYALIYRQRPRASVLAAVAVTYLGILLVVSGLDLGLLRRNIDGAGLVLACALTMAVYYLASDRWAAVLGSMAFTLCALAAATTLIGADYLARHGTLLPSFAPRDAALMAGLVGAATVMPMLAMAESVRHLGAERAAVISTVGPPITLLLGAWLLDERLVAGQWFGVALIVAGILILEAARRPDAGARAPDG